MNPLKNNSEVEMDSLEYLWGYVLHNPQIKFERNQDKNAIALQFLNNFKSNTVDDQTLINLQNRGGLTGINSNAKIIFVKAEYLFRDLTIKNPREIDCDVLLQMALTEVDICSASKNCISSSEAEHVEIEESVIEKMLSLYWRIRAFSYARDDVTEKKKMEKHLKPMQKALRKELQEK